MESTQNHELFLQKAQELVQRMTLEETISQLRYDSPAIDRLGIPAMNWWNEGLHGVARAGTATVFPQAIGLAASFSPELLHQIADVIATEARAKHREAALRGDRDIYKGLTLWSPNVNLFRDPRWGRGQETYGEDPLLLQQLGCAFVRGLQGDGTYWKTAACAKHFAVHSGPEALRHSFDAQVSPKDLEDTYLPAFRALVQDAGVAGVMGAYNRVNGESACANTALSKLLYEDWGFQGYFVSDCWALRDFHTEHGVTHTFPESAALALNHGCHLNCGCTYLYVQQAYEEGLVSEAVIRQAAVRLLAIRLHLGLFAQTEYDAIPYELVDCPAHRALAQKAAEQSIVLLENDGILPLSVRSDQTLAVIGPNADSLPALRGNYYGTPAVHETFLQGIQNAFPGRVLYAQGCPLCEDREEPLALPGDRLAEAEAAAAHADIVLVYLGLNETLEGEQGDEGNAAQSGDRQDLSLPESQQALLRTLQRTGKPLIVLTACGSSITLPEGPRNAWLHTWYPGELGGKALARILFGEISPSGKLPITFYRDLEGLPDFSDYSMQGRTYRYADTAHVLYPFGFGLTYGTTAVSHLKVQVTADSVIVSATACFSSRVCRKAEDVLLVFWHSNAPDDTAHRTLCDFQRLSFQSDTPQQVTFCIPKSRFTVVDQAGRRYLDQTASYEIELLDQHAGFSL